MDSQKYFTCDPTAESKNTLSTSLQNTHCSIFALAFMPYPLSFLSCSATIATWAIVPL